MGFVPACKKKVGQPKYTSSASSEKAGQIVKAKSLKKAANTVKEVLALGGIGTADAAGWEYEPLQPAATALAVPPETMKLAAEARNRASAGRMTLDELGTMLMDFGWPFPAGKTPGEHMKQFLSGWVTDAMSHREDAASFTPLFLAEMARLQNPPIDLAGTAYKPVDLRLTLLELQLIAGAFDRALRPPGTDAVKPFAFNSSSGVAYASEACSDAKKWLGELGGDVVKTAVESGQVALGEAVGAGLKKAMELGGIAANQAENMSKAISAMGTAAKVWKVVTLYANTEVAVSVESDNPIHKALKSEAPKFTAFKAQAGVSNEDWKAYKDDMGSSETVRSLRDCFNIANLPVFPDLGDLGKDAANWSVEWTLIQDSPPHGLISRDKNDFFLPGQLQMQLHADGDHSASALLVVDLTPEKGASHTGKEKTAPLTAKAALDTSAAPTLGTFVNAVKGGLGDMMSLTDAIVELAGGWIQALATPKAYATLIVQYHELGNWKGSIQIERTYSADENRVKTQGKLNGTVTLTDQPDNSIPPVNGTVKVKAKGTFSGYIDNTISKVNPQNEICSYSADVSHLDLNGTKDTEVNITVKPDMQTYTISISRIQLSGNVENTHKFGGGPLSQGCKSTGPFETKDVQPGGGEIISLELTGKLDPANPNRLFGTQTYSSSGVTTTTRWELYQE